MKFTQTALPRIVERSIVPPPTWGTSRAGAGWPMWKFSVADDDPGDAAPEPDATADPAADAAADGDAPADASPGLPDGSAGAGDRRTGSGPTNTNATSNAPATSRPASRPATMESRDPMRRERTSTTVTE